MFLADAGLYDKYFSTGPGSLSSPLDPYLFPESVFIPSIPPPPPSSSSSQARYPPPPPPPSYSYSYPYPYPSHPSAVQAIAGSRSIGGSGYGENGIGHVGSLEVCV